METKINIILHQKLTQTPVDSSWSVLNSYKLQTRMSEIQL